jgi:hypothetical protein
MSWRILYATRATAVWECLLRAIAALVMQCYSNCQPRKFSLLALSLSMPRALQQYISLLVSCRDFCESTTMYRLVMVGWDWRLRTATSTGLLFIPGWSAMRATVWWCWLRLTPNLSTRALWQPPVLAGGPISRDISGASGRVGEGNENLVYPSPWDFKRSFTCRKILRYGNTGFTYHPKEGVLRTFIALKNPSSWLGSNPATFGSSGMHSNHYTTKVTWIDHNTFMRSV